jgi:nucleotide-binding universal stress UspA family protein
VPSVEVDDKRKENKMPGILVGIDGSAHSRRALEWAVREAAVRQAPLTVLTVYHAAVGYWSVPVQYATDADLAKQTLQAAQEETDDVLKQAGDEPRPPSVTVKSAAGLPAEELLSAAADADMIVVGSRGAGGFKRLLMGSVSTQVTHHAHCPVVVIPADRT